MKTRLKILFLMLFTGLFIGPNLTVSAAPTKKAKKAPFVAKKLSPKKPQKSVQKKPSPAVSADFRFAQLKQKYRLGDIDNKTMWSNLSSLEGVWQSLSPDKRVNLLQTQARLLYDDDYPILAAIYSAQTIKTSKTPLDQDLLPSWKILWEVSQKRPIQGILSTLAGDLSLGGEPAPSFGTGWFYFIGSNAESKNDLESALDAYARVNLTDRHFFPAKYQRAMIFVDQNKIQDAEASLDAILFPTSLEMSALQGKSKSEMVNYARIALARLYYEKRDFMNAIKMYRLIDRESPLFYDSLFEQSWAFFMGGYPNHALGAIHSVESPFFKDQFNPEASLLKAITHYWLCRYDDSRAALADFMEKHASGVESLEGFLDRRRLGPDTAFRLFEDVLADVSSESLGIPRNILLSAAEKDSMLLVRDQYASILNEKYKLKNRGIYGSRTAIDRPSDYLDRLTDSLKVELGTRYLTELKIMKSEFERLYSQAQFLYVELLMSEKERLLGKDLHASSKMTKISTQQNIKGWGRGTQSWATSDKNEFWWDEIGFYIFNVKPMCAASSVGN